MIKMTELDAETSTTKTLVAECEGLVETDPNQAVDLVEKLIRGWQSGRRQMTAAELASIHGVRASALRQSGRYEEGAGAAEEAVRLFQELGAERQAFQARLDWIYCNWKKGNAKDSLAAARDLRETATQSAQSHDLGCLALTRGSIQMEAGHLAEAVAAFEQSARHFLDAGEETWRLEALHNLGKVHCQMGNHPKALLLFRSILQEPAVQSSSFLRASTTISLGELAAAQGDHPEAERCYREALEIIGQLPEWESIALLNQNLGILYKEMGRFEEAMRHLERGLEIQRREALPSGQALSLAAMAEVYMQRNQWPQAEKAARESLDLASLRQARLPEIRARFCLGQIAWRHPDRPCDWPTVFAHLEEAKRLAEGSGLSEESMTAHELLALACEGTMRWREAYEHAWTASSIKSRLHSEQTARKLRNLQLTFDLERIRQEVEITRLKNVELAAANQRLEQMVEEKNVFLGMAAHDLRDPLNGVHMAGAMLLQDRVETADLKMIGETILDSTARMLATLRFFLDSSRLQENQTQLETQAVEVGGQLRQVAERFRSQAVAKSISIEIEPPSSPVTVKADPYLLAEVLDNLVSNAIKYTPAGRQVRLHVTPREGRWALWVTDQGPGIPSAERARLFRPFSRLQHRPTAGESSRGLGLAIARKLTEAMGGQIECQSVVGAGSSFIVTLPDQGS